MSNFAKEDIKEFNYGVSIGFFINAFINFILGFKDKNMIAMGIVNLVGAVAIVIYYNIKHLKLKHGKKTSNNN